MHAKIHDLIHASLMLLSFNLPIYASDGGKEEIFFETNQKPTTLNLQDIMKNIESAAVTTRSIGFVSFLGGAYQLGAFQRNGKTTKGLQHGLKSAACFLPAYWLFKSYNKLYETYEIVENQHNQQPIWEYPND